MFFLHSALSPFFSLPYLFIYARDLIRYPSLTLKSAKKMKLHALAFLAIASTASAAVRFPITK